MLCTALTLTSFCMTAGSRQLDRHEAAIIAREAAIVDVEVNNFTVSLFAKADCTVLQKKQHRHWSCGPAGRKYSACRTFVG